MNRADCKDGPRPCHKLSCRYHLLGHQLAPTGLTGKARLLDHIEQNAKVVLRDLTKAEHTCALDVADQGGHTLEEVGAILGLTRERIRQVEAQALLKIRARVGGASAFEDYQHEVSLARRIKQRRRAETTVEEVQQCIACGEHKDLDDFRMRTDGQGLRSRCIACEQAKERRNWLKRQRRQRQRERL